MIQLIDSIPFFTHWSKHMKRRLNNAMQPVDVIQKAKIIREGSFNEHVYIVWKGEIQGRRQTITEISATG